MAAPKGNKFAEGLTNSGRPPHFASPELMQVAIDEFFEITDHITITGLALHLGFVDRQSLYDYEKKEEFTCTIKKARTRVEQWYERNLMSASVTGSIFALKNMGWKDKTEVDSNVNMGIVWNEQKTYDSKQETNSGT